MISYTPRPAPKLSLIDLRHAFAAESREASGPRGITACFVT